MEQKTEASQAVENLVRACKTATSDAEKVAAIDAYRAALKAQPAPTEAAQRESPFKFRPWSKEAEMVEGWTAAEKAREAAQGDDSARLLVAVKAYRDLQRKIRTAGRPPHSDYWHQALYEAEAAIDAALASAETGGVKS